MYGFNLILSAKVATKHPCSDSLQIFADPALAPLESIQVIQVGHDLSPISGTRRLRGNKEFKLANVRKRTYCDVHMAYSECNRFSSARCMARRGYADYRDLEISAFA
jgi:hypothetical protein